MPKKYTKYTQLVGGATEILPLLYTLQGKKFVMVARFTSEAFYCVENKLKKGRALIAKTYDLRRNGFLLWKHMFSDEMSGLRVAFVKTAQNGPNWNAQYFNYAQSFETVDCYNPIVAVRQLEAHFERARVFLDIRFSPGAQFANVDCCL